MQISVSTLILVLNFLFTPSIIPSHYRYHDFLLFLTEHYVSRKVLQNIFSEYFKRTFYWGDAPVTIWLYFVKLFGDGYRYTCFPVMLFFSIFWICLYVLLLTVLLNIWGFHWLFGRVLQDFCFSMDLLTLSLPLPLLLCLHYHYHLDRNCSPI